MRSDNFSFFGPSLVSSFDHGLGSSNGEGFERGFGRILGACQGLVLGHLERRRELL